jgi:DNA-binding response OmpR family regulator
MTLTVFTQQPKRQSASCGAGDIYLQGMTVLVIDDDNDSLEVLSAFFEACGARPLIARNAAGGLAYLDTAPKLAAVVTDLAMPDTDGIEFARRRRHPTRKQLPVIAVRFRHAARRRRRGVRAEACPAVDRALLSRRSSKRRRRSSSRLSSAANAVSCGPSRLSSAANAVSCAPLPVMDAGVASHCPMVVPRSCANSSVAITSLSARDHASIL